jgi:hypothetical protein
MRQILRVLAFGTILAVVFTMGWFLPPPSIVVHPAQAQFVRTVTGTFVYNALLTPTATGAAIATVQQTFTMTGINVGDIVRIEQSPTPTSLCPPVGVRATAANQITIDFLVLTAAACTPAPGNYVIAADR